MIVVGSVAVVGGAIVGVRFHVQVLHHGLKPFFFFRELQLQLGNDLHLDASLRRAPIIELVFQI